MHCISIPHMVVVFWRHSICESPADPIVTWGRHKGLSTYLSISAEGTATADVFFLSILGFASLGSERFSMLLKWRLSCVCN